MDKVERTATNFHSTELAQLKKSQDEVKKQVAEAEKRKAGQSKAMRKLSEEREAQV